jgi:hypothetical protein
MKKPLLLILFILTTIFSNCNGNKDKSSYNDNDWFVLQTISFGKYNNEKYISLLKKRVVKNSKNEEVYVLKDNLKEYEINSYFSKFNTKRTDKSKELSLKQYSYTDNSTQIQRPVFILQFTNSDYCSYTFFEYRKDILYVSHFFEHVFINELGSPTQNPLANEDVSYAFSINEIDIRADVFFSKSFIFDSIHKKHERYNYLNNRNEWIKKPQSKQEEWVLKHFLYK